MTALDRHVRSVTRQNHTHTTTTVMGKKVVMQPDDALQEQKTSTRARE